MTNEELKMKLEELFPGSTFEEETQWLTLNMEAEGFKPVAQQLRNNESFNFDFLFCLGNK